MLLGFCRVMPGGFPNTQAVSPFIVAINAHPEVLSLSQQDKTKDDLSEMFRLRTLSQASSVFLIDHECQRGHDFHHTFSLAMTPQPPP